MSDRPKLKDLVNAVRSVTDWYDLGLQVDLPKEILNNIRFDPDSSHHKTLMLSKWLDYDPAASWQKLAYALNTMGQKVAAEEVIKTRFIGIGAQQPAAEQPQKSAEQPQQPVKQPQKSAEQPQQPMKQPQKSAEQPQQPAEPPQQPAEQPQKSAEQPQQPAEQSQKSAEQPQQSAEQPQKPAEQPQKPVEQPQHPELNSKPCK